ncbi:MAG TPA: ATP-dependent Clp protease proteolytic subunit [Thermodesulfobacteriota bacterium]|nr:ATP-dependent Clp protease proteolytic subunit [Thermodesulfobacteriota bacterium]
MGILELFWLFLLVSAVQPLIRQRMLEANRLRLLARFERQRGSRAIALVHRQETMSLLGFPLMRYIDINDSEAVLRAIQLTDPERPIDLIVHTPGGLALAAAQIARALSRHRGRVTVFVPHYAMSGGTLIALAADEIVMDEHAVLGPLDPQLGQTPAASVLSVLAQKAPQDIEDETLIRADVARKAIAQMRATVRTLLVDNGMAPDKADAVAEKLTGGTWTHDYPITVEEARALGLPVTTGMPPEIYAFMELFPQPARTARPSVEYVPLPYRDGPRQQRR